MSFALDALILASGITHVLLSPYTKVEESFNLHATHDVLFYGIYPPANLNKYDHFVFPGAVPRTFVGSVLLAWISKPLIYLASSFGLVNTKFDIQILIRLVLATFNAFALCLLRRAVSRRFGRPTGLFYALLTISQFHVPFWMGRTLPNMFAFFPATLSTYLLIDRAPNSLKPSRASIDMAISLLAFSAVVFRAELALLLAPTALWQLIRGNTSFWRLLRTGVIASVLSAALTITVDSYFWNQWPLWPEFNSVFFNVYQGKSAEWGVSPFHTYLTSSLPKLLLFSLPLSILGTLLDSRIRSILISPIIFILLISCLAHKEWRFVVYVVPVFNIAAARGARWMSTRRKGTLLGRLLFLAVASIIPLNFLATTMFTIASMNNYPGGEAMRRFNDRYGNDTTTNQVHVHICNLAAQSGASLFLQTNAPPYLPSSTTTNDNLKKNREWIYSKTENLSLTALTSNKSITHLIIESPLSASSLSSSASGWKVVDVVEGYVRWVVAREDEELERVGDLVRMVREEKLWIVEREGSSSGSGSSGYRWF